MWLSAEIEYRNFTFMDCNQKLSILSKNKFYEHIDIYIYISVCIHVHTHAHSHTEHNVDTGKHIDT